MYAYVGSRTTRERNARGDGITVFEVDPSSGTLEQIQLVGDLVNPSYLALSADGANLYCVHGDRSEVSAFRVDRETGRLAFVNQQSTQGRNPVHLALGSGGRFLVVTNHIGASLAVLPIRADGALEPLVQRVPICRSDRAAPRRAAAGQAALQPVRSIGPLRRRPRQGARPGLQLSLRWRRAAARGHAVRDGARRSGSAQGGFSSALAAGLRGERTRFHGHDVPLRSGNGRTESRCTSFRHCRRHSPATAARLGSRSIGRGDAFTHPTGVTTASRCSASTPTAACPSWSTRDPRWGARRGSSPCHPTADCCSR